MSNNVEEKYRLSYLLSRHKEAIREMFSNRCPICGVVFNSMKGVIVHLRKNHFDEFLNLLENLESKKSYKGDVCPICGKAFITMKTHVKKVHGLSWEDFVNKTGYTGKGISRSPETKAKLSEKKKAFYKSPEGLLYKKVQSERISGGNNPACRPEVRDKISRACLGRPCPRKLKEINSSRGVDKIIRGELSTLGYFYKLIYDNKYYYARSTAEFTVLLSLLKNNIKFNQESMKIKYLNELGDNRYYLPDFVVGKTVYETKVTEKELETFKYREIKKTLNSVGYDFKLLNKSSFKKELGVFPITKRELEDFIKVQISNHLLQIVPPNTHYGEDRPFLKKILGDDYEIILKENEEKFNENKKYLCI